MERSVLNRPDHLVVQPELTKQERNLELLPTTFFLAVQDVRMDEDVKYQLQ